MILWLFQADFSIQKGLTEPIRQRTSVIISAASSAMASNEHFCCEDNGYAIYYNQPDFNWGAVIYTMCVEPVHISSNRKIMLSYKSGVTDIGEMWLVPKSNEALAPADAARYVYEAIQNHTAISIPFGWLGTVGNYVNVLHECSGINDGEYYLAWKAVTDNTSPMIRSVKVVDVTI